MSQAPRIDRIDKNYFINGGLDFFQRGGASVAVNISTTPSYVAPDRFLVSYTGTVTGTPTVVRVANTMVSSNRAFYAIRFSAQRNASTLSNTTEQRIESFESQELVTTGSASFSFWVFSPIASSQARLTLNVPTAQDNYTAVTQIFQQTSSTTIPASTWTKIVFAGVTIPSTASNGLSAVFDLLVPSGTDGSPQNYLFTQFMANAGMLQSEFTRQGKSIGHELTLCQRYYEKSYDIDTAPGSVTDNGGEFMHSTGTTNRPLFHLNFKTLKRIPPVLNTWSPFSGTPATAFNQDTGTDVGNTLVQFSSGQTSSTFYVSGAVTANDGYRIQWAVNAEL